MQAPPRVLTLDQLRSPTQPANSAEIAGTVDAARQPLALLNQMLRALAPTDAPDIIARRLVTLARQATGMDLCVVTLVDAEDGVTGGSGMNASARGGRCLSIRASAPDVNARILDEPPKVIDPVLWQKLRQPTIAGQLPALDTLELEALNPLRNVTYGSLLIVPLVAGTECVGLLCGYNSSARDLTEQELLVLQTISSYAAMSITSSALLDHAHTGTPVQAFFDEVLADNQPHEDVLRGRAIALGYDLTQPSAMLMLEIVASSEDRKEPGEGGAGSERQLKSRRVLASVHAWVKEQYPRSLIHAREHRLYCIVALEHDDGAARLDSWLTALMQEIESDYDTRLCAGIGSVCTDLRDYARGFAEALEALRIGECLRGHVASARFNQLGPYRYLSPFARDRHLSDTHLNHIENLARYDREHKRGDLLHSLETYLTLGSNIKDASELLKVHRNTLTQRLERIQTLCGVNLDDHRECFALQMAIMIYRLSSERDDEISQPGPVSLSS